MLNKSSSGYEGVFFCGLELSQSPETKSNRLSRCDTEVRHLIVSIKWFGLKSEASAPSDLMTSNFSVLLIFVQNLLELL